MPRNRWAVICPEMKAPGLWMTWLNQECVAIGWPPSRYHLMGPTDTTAWKSARERVLAIEPGDIVIPYLTPHRFGIPGIVKKLAIEDGDWNPTVPKGGYSGNPDERELGRRIYVEWLKKDAPPPGMVVVIPVSIRKTYGEVRAAIEPVLPERYSRFMKLIGDRRNWKAYGSEEASSDLKTGAIQFGDAGPRQGHQPTHLKAAGLLAGDKLYLERAREAFPILVRQAHARQTIYYSNLARELRMANPRNLNYVLGAIGKSIQGLAIKWKQKIPPLQCLAVNKNTGMPGEGIGWFSSDLDDFRKRSDDEKREILKIELVKVFNYPGWESVLRAFDLEPLPPDSVVSSLKERAKRMGGVGECEDHRKLKLYVAKHPSIIGLSNSDMGNIEYRFPSADRIDVVFNSGDAKAWTGVEVKGPSSPNEDIVRGMFQCVKYAALRDAELKSEAKNGSTRVMLVLSNKLPSQLEGIRNLLGIEIVDGIVVPDSTNFD